jgi:hypothetical protein
MSGLISPAVRAARKVAAAAMESPASAYGVIDTIVFALDSAQLLQSPETAADLARLRERVTELEAALASLRRLVTEGGERPEPIPACARCRRPFDQTDTRWDGHARHNDTPFCRSCVDRCHDSEIADHRCQICTPAPSLPAEGGEQL